jgi:hypothetical protein
MSERLNHTTSSIPRNRGTLSASRFLSGVVSTSDLLQRFTIAVESPAKLKEAHQALLAQREEFAIMEIGEIQDNSDGASFLIRDPIVTGGRSNARGT